MNTNPLISDFFRIIKPIPYKNAGGCLFFAYAFWRWLKKHQLDTSVFQLVQYDFFGEQDLWANMSWIAETVSNNGTPTGKTRSANHFTWLYNGEEFDSEGPCSHDKNCQTVLTGLNDKICLVDTFCLHALVEGGWNYCFNRGEAIAFCRDNLNMTFVKLLRMQKSELATGYWGGM